MIRLGKAMEFIFLSFEDLCSVVLAAKQSASHGDFKTNIAHF